ncbi:MAG: HD domain-containing protein [Lachnospiraceae bacterium]|nr:HD domain-containing protein [Lachnospiraceae bacterium]
MLYLYLICIIISMGMLLWLKLFDVRNSITQFISLLCIIISNLGFYFIAVSENLEEAILAQKITYVGGAFLPMVYFLLVAEICHIDLPRMVSVFFVVVQCIIFGFVCTIGRGELFYKSVSMYTKGGITLLNKEYGPVHTVHIISLFIYLAAAMATAVYSLIKKKSVNRRGMRAMIILSAIAVGVYVSERIIGLEYEIVSVAYVVLMIGALIPVYDSNVFTVYENRDIINEQLGKVGFLTFDKKRIYKGCNGFMSTAFPELLSAQVGQRLVNCSEELQSIIDQIDRLEQKYGKGEKREHIHIHLDPLLYNDKYYAGTIHGVSNAFGRLKGYTIELRDETEHYKALALREHYNEELTNAVNEKTRRIRLIQQKTILGMAQMVESRDLSTGGHIKRTSDVVRIFAKKILEANLGLDKKFLRLVVRSAPMHDLGKIGVDDAILRKQGRFTELEYNVMKEHSEIGYRMVKEILSDVEDQEFVSVAENVAHYHHEKIDGTGYPAGLKGEEIPIEARIMALADVFDALVSKRCYKDSYSYDKAFSIIESDAGTHFDERLAQVFLLCRKELEEYYDAN